MSGIFTLNKFHRSCILTKVNLRKYEPCIIDGHGGFGVRHVQVIPSESLSPSSYAINPSCAIQGTFVMNSENDIYNMIQKTKELETNEENS